MFVIAAAGAVLVCAVSLTLIGLRQDVVYFVAPSELAQKAAPGRRVRVGGLVVRGSVHRDASGSMRFDLTDGAHAVAVRYTGLMPDLFGEGQGVVAEGVWAPATGFVAERILAKHDERYMPPEVAEALRRRGEWRGATDPQRQTTTAGRAG